MGGLLIQSGANGHLASLPTFGDLERRPAPVHTLLRALEPTEALSGRPVGSCVAHTDPDRSLCWLTGAWVEGLAGRLHLASLQIRLAMTLSSYVFKSRKEGDLVTCPSTAPPSSVRKFSSCLKSPSLNIPSGNLWPSTSVT